MDGKLTYNPPKNLAEDSSKDFAKGVTHDVKREILA